MWSFSGICGMIRRNKIVPIRAGSKAEDRGAALDVIGLLRTAYGSLKKALPLVCSIDHTRVESRWAVSTATFIGCISARRNLQRKVCCGVGWVLDAGSIGLGGWHSAISFRRPTHGCGFNPAYLRGCGCRFVFPEKRASCVASMNPKCRTRFWLRFTPVLLSMTLARMWELWL